MTSPSSRRLLSARDLAFVSVFVGIVAALGVAPSFQAAGMSVPITFQSMGVMLAGAILGARRGFLALAVFILLVAAGLPLLPPGVGGLGLFATPRAGFLVGFPIAALAVGLLSELAVRRSGRYDPVRGFVANVLGGIAVLYAFGIPGMMIFADLGIDEAFTASWAFIPGDLVKAVLAAVIAAGVHRGYPGLLVRESDEQREPTAV